MLWLEAPVNEWHKVFQHKIRPFSIFMTKPLFFYFFFTGASSCLKNPGILTSVCVYYPHAVEPTGYNCYIKLQWGMRHSHQALPRSISPRQFHSYQHKPWPLSTERKRGGRGEKSRKGEKHSKEMSKNCINIIIVENRLTSSFNLRLTKIHLKNFLVSNSSIGIDN